MVVLWPYEWKVTDIMALFLLNISCEENLAEGQPLGAEKPPTNGLE